MTRGHEPQAVTLGAQAIFGDTRPINSRRRAGKLTAGDTNYLGGRLG